VSPEDSSLDPITVVLVDDHALVRGALRALLDAQEDLEVIAEAGSLESAKAALSASPRVLVLDVNLPDGVAVEAIAELRQLAPETAIVMLTMDRDLSLARQALEQGTLGYLFKDAAHLELIESVRAAAAGRRYLPAALAAGLAGKDGGEAPQPLSPREIEVLRLMALGHTNREIGEQLDLSVRTVETHRSHIQQKLNLSTRPELTRYALDHGLIEP
jgi:two-component system response regulator NreC